MSREVFFIADDFGRNTAINHAILEAHRRGALQGASLMMGQPGTEEALALARDQPSLQIGWHLHLCDSQPLTRARWPWGDSPWQAGLSIGLTSSGRRLMTAEVRAQWAAFQAGGLPGMFLNTHHHLHAHPAVWAALVRTVPGDFRGWVRLGTPMRCHGTAGKSAWFWRRRRRRSPWPVSDTLWGVDQLHRMDAAVVRANLARLGAGRHEFLFHPCRLTNDADLAALIALRGAV